MHAFYVSLDLPTTVSHLPRQSKDAQHGIRREYSIRHHARLGHSPLTPTGAELEAAVREVVARPVDAAEEVVAVVAACMQFM